MCLFILTLNQDLKMLPVHMSVFFQMETSGCNLCKPYKIFFYAHFKSSWTHSFPLFVVHNVSWATDQWHPGCWMLNRARSRKKKIPFSWSILSNVNVKLGKCFFSNCKENGKLWIALIKQLFNPRCGAHACIKHPHKCTHTHPTMAKAAKSHRPGTRW